MPVRPLLVLPLAFALLAPAAASSAGAGTPVAATSKADAEVWGHRVDEMAQSGHLRIARFQADGDFPGRRHLRYEQHAGEVRVFGAQLVRQLAEDGGTLTVFGRLVDAPDVIAAPALTAEQAARAAESAMGRAARAVGEVELVWLPLDERPVLAWTLWARIDHRLERFFVDASTGVVVLRQDDLHTATAVGLGTGVWGDRKKVSAEGSGGSYRAEDTLRPPRLVTYDMRFDLGATGRFVNTREPPQAFVARDEDNDWRDGGVVDAHVYAGWTYDYYFRRHGRRGIDDRDLPIRSITHFAAPLFQLANAFWDPSVDAMFYGDGDGEYGVFSGALDVVAHELTHGVTSHSWGGNYASESGALNEAFSDVMGTAVEFFFEPPGDGRQRADYWLGEDLSFVFEPPLFAARSMENPSRLCGPNTGCGPDHYSKRYRGPLDNGGVHVNAGIANHAFFLLVEGGVNRTSHVRVAGLGPAGRERAEKIFYRGFTSFLTPRATFRDARAATLQAARELYGSVEVEQVAAAWTAVGVE
jgi:Zn-dependent metalloprotease